MEDARLAGSVDIRYVSKKLEKKALFNIGKSGRKLWIEGRLLRSS